jgi:predicted metalloprotease with PDZ domain
MTRLRQRGVSSLPRRAPSTRGHMRQEPAPITLFLLCMTLSLAGQLPAAQAPAPRPLEIEYTLRVVRPTTHLVDVEILARKVEATDLTFVMPAWGPGRYAIYDFSKNVQGFSAQGANQQPLSWTALDKQTWRVDASQAGGTVKVQYRVFANDLSGSFSQVDSTHANLNGPSIFMYVEGHKPDAVTLKIDAPDSWKVFSGFSTSSADRTFRAANYDALVDTPLEISPECTLDQFQEQGKTIQVVVHTYGENDKDRSQLLEGIKKLVHAEMAAMPPPDLQHYLFIFHFAPGVSLGDGMEHLNSTQIIVRSNVRDGSQEALESVAHEFFHLWNVKRLRPAALGPFDYTRENYTRSLWFAEGVTSYCAYLFLLRSGLWTREQFLNRLASEIYDLEREPGRELMSAESSSFHAWFFDRSPQMQETNFANTTISYYNKGALLGMLLDVEIHARTQGRRSLLDLVRTMYQKFYEAPAASYYGPGRGYEEDDIAEALKSVAGSDFTSFFERYVGGTEALPYQETLKSAGFELRAAAAPDAAPSLGVLVQPENQGARVFAVIPGGPAERAGLSRDDLLIDVDDQSLATEDLSTRLRAYPVEASVPMTVERHGRRERVTVTLGPPARTQYSIVPLPSTTPEQEAVRNGWLGTP